MKYVKIKPEIGYGPGLYQVVSETTGEYQLKPLGGGATFSLFKAHTKIDIECKRATTAYAQKIGRK